MNIKSIYSFHIPKYSQFIGFGLNKASYPNLAPLPKDTVSFSGRSELLAESMSDAPQVKICKNIEENASGAAYYLYAVLDKYLSGIADFKENSTTHDTLRIRPKTKSKQNSSKIATYELRIKSASSIREKVVSKYTKLHKNEHKKFADELLNQLSARFPISVGVDRKVVIDTIKQHTKHSGTAQKSSAYRDAQHHVPNVIGVLKELKMLDFSNATDEDIRIATREITEELKKTPSDLIVDGKFADPKTVQGAKHYANDVVGARIVLQDSDKENCDKILSALKKAVDDGLLTITSIENNVPDENKIPPQRQLSDYEYASKNQLQSLSKVANAPLITNKSQTGYMAIHINLDFNNPLFRNYNGIFNGYTGEIQIIGRDVAQLKHVEDLCYKFKDKKNAVNIAYKPFREYFLKHYQGDVKQAFDDYTYALYLAQRDYSSKRKLLAFPSIEELGFAGKVPKELDFNRLRTIYEGCRTIAESNEADSPKKSITSDKDIIMAGNFKTIKKLIDHKVNP